jgi:hypothetical protein
MASFTLGNVPWEPIMFGAGVATATYMLEETIVPWFLEHKWILPLLLGTGGFAIALIWLRS